MKIERIEAIPLRAEVGVTGLRPFAVRHSEAVGRVLFSGYGTTLVRIVTTDGTEGIGECGGRLAPTVAAELVTTLAPILIGADARSIGLQWDRLYAVLESAGHSKGFFIEAISGIDMALWDLRGRALGVPLFDLLGGARRDRLPVYASALSLAHDIEHLRRQATAFVDAGHTRAKAKIGHDPCAPDDELARLRTLATEFSGALTFMVDGNGMFDFTTALKVGRVLDDIGALWFEEPLPPTARHEHARLAEQLDTPIAGGESEHTRFHFRDIVLQRVYEILQPNVARCGGVTEARHVVSMCDTFGLKYSPHIGTSSGVCIAASLHLAASAGHLAPVECVGNGWHPDYPNPFRDELVAGRVDSARDGTVAVPMSPGLGIQIDWDVVDRYRVRPV